LDAMSRACLGRARFFCGGNYSRHGAERQKI
jgi:hypothetical protein